MQKVQMQNAHVYIYIHMAFKIYYHRFNANF